MTVHCCKGRNSKAKKRESLMTDGGKAPSVETDDDVVDKVLFPSSRVTHLIMVSARHRWILGPDSLQSTARGEV